MLYLDIIVLKKEHAKEIASLHIQNISRGFISSLGLEFVTILYQTIAEDKGSFGFVAVQESKILGFVAVSTNLSNLYKQMIFKKGIKISFLLIRKMISWHLIKKIWENLCYPMKTRKMNLPSTEILSIAVVPEAQGRGIARRLIEAALGECRRCGITAVKVLVSSENHAANKLYQSCGFQKFCQYVSHGVISNIYLIPLRPNKFQSSSGRLINS